MIGENVTDAQLNEMLALADLDKDGKINYEGKANSRVLAKIKFDFHISVFLLVFHFRICEIALVD